ncbi:MAG: hypothetical protein P1V81_04175 [Planctomycetota bacterium]|nr:hypothetical protein [Planctomycetota bacterium]
MLVPFLAGGLVLGACIGRFWFLCDDAYILFRYARNLARGDGLDFNPSSGTPVEGFSEFLWTLLLAIPEALGLATPVLAPVVTSLGSFALLWVLLAFGRRVLGLGTIGLVAAALFFGSLPTVGVWSSGGLSTSLSALLIFLTYRSLFGQAPTARTGWAAGTWGALACLMRADGPYWIGILLVLFLASGQIGSERRAPGATRQVLARAALVLLLVGGAFLAWRYLTFGDVVPNTARAKVGMTALSLERGAKYLGHYWAILPATLCVFAFGLARLVADRERGFTPSGVATLMVAATFAYAVLVGGDFMTMGRFFFTAAPFLALLFGDLVQRAWGRSALFASALAGVLLVTSVLPAFDRYATPPALREALWFRWSEKQYSTEYGFWYGMGARAEEWSLLGRALAHVTSPGESLVLGGIGAVGYHCELTILDRHGLVNAEVLEASQPASRRRSPGHDRAVPIEFFSRYEPTYREAFLTRNPFRDKRVRASDRGHVHALPVEAGFPEGLHLVLRPW